MSTPTEPSHADQPELEADPLAVFEHQRRRLFAVAYRMLGSVSEAEDVLQDAYLRWHAVDHAAVSNAAAYLVSLVTRLCIDTLRAARTRRTQYIGPWLPEPLLAEQALPHSEDPAALHELAEDLSMAFLLLLERLSPVERAVFLLHESFDFSYREIAGIVNKTEENCRQIERRARKHLSQDGSLTPADPDQHDQLLTRFLLATREGDLDAMVNLLAHDAVMYADGGGKVNAARRPVAGAERIARVMLGIVAKAEGVWEGRLTQVNGRTGLVNLLDGQMAGVMAFDVRDGQIQQIFVVANPDKLPRI